MARVLLGVTGGIAAYKTCELARLLVSSGHEVTPILTPEAETFVSAKTFEALARREAPRALYPHLVQADLLVVAPLSANTLAKLAHGLADNVLTQTALAFEGPVLAAPAMNPRMWRSEATQANVEALRARAVDLVGPEEGDTAEGEVGMGRMSEPEAIFERVRTLLEKRDQLRPAGARHGRRDARAARRGALPRQPLVGPYGLRRGCRGAQARGRGDVRGLEPDGARARRSGRGAGADRRGRRPGDARSRRRGRGRNGGSGCRLPAGSRW
jgi:phosphopantothenoylcysteine decarboxylase/phosphopantothenate--cysteine ligase